MEAPVGFEPTIRVLQTHALPLGYGAINNIDIIPHDYSICKENLDNSTSVSCLNICQFLESLLIDCFQKSLLQFLLQTY